MSHIDVTPLSLMIQPQVETISSAVIVTDAARKPSFARGLAFGLVLALTFWTVVAIAIIVR